MNKLSILVIIIVLLVGCTNKSIEPTIVPTVKPEDIPVSSDPTEVSPPESTSNFQNVEKSENDSFSKQNINGVFDVYISDNLPDQMYLETDSFEPAPAGRFAFVIKSNDASCKSVEKCTQPVYSFLYGTEEALSTLEEDKKDAIFEMDTPDGTIYIFKCPTCNMECRIEDGNGPNYLNDLLNGTKEILQSDLIRFE